MFKYILIPFLLFSTPVLAQDVYNPLGTYKEGQCINNEIDIKKALRLFGSLGYGHVISYMEIKGNISFFHEVLGNSKTKMLIGFTVQIKDNKILKMCIDNEGLFVGLVPNNNPDSNKPDSNGPVEQQPKDNLE